MSEKLNKQKKIFKRKLFWLAFIYFLLLIWSGIYRYNRYPISIPKTKETVELKVFDGDKMLEREIRFAFIETNSNIRNDKFPVIFIHGSPGSAEVFDGLSKYIENRPLISVDLPGFGDSEQDIPNYSIYSHAKYLQEFLDAKNIEKAHFVGFSLGGGVILHLSELSPDKVASVSFVSSIGVQEYELLGDYYINHFIHGVQLTFCWIVQELTPHFGVFDGVPMSYSRNFYDTDQRPLRKILEEFDKPFQIIHGKNDPLVPIEVAREHKRIVPQSEYHELDDNHFFIFQRPEKIDDLLEKFWSNVEKGEAKTRLNADDFRIAEANKAFEIKILQAKGATIFVFFLFLVILAFFNEDLAFLLAGIFVAQGRFGFMFAIISCLSGIVLSIIFWLLIGKFYGDKSSFFDKFEDYNIFTNRNFGFRFPIYFANGKRKDGFWIYPIKLILSAIFWAVLLIFAFYLLTKCLIYLTIFTMQNTFGLILFLVIFYSIVSICSKQLLSFETKTER